MIVVGACPCCGEPVTLKQPGRPGRQRVWCSRRCLERAAKRRQRGRTLTALNALTDAQLLRIPQAALEPYGVEF